MKKKHIIVTALTALLFSTGGIQAQERTDMPAYRDELGVSIYGLSLASMPFEGNVQWKDKMGMALGLGADYTRWFNANMGLTAGLKLSILEHNQEVGPVDMTFQGTHNIVGIGETSVTMLAENTSIREGQTWAFIEIPVRFSLKHDNLYCNLGLSLSFAAAHSTNYAYECESYNITGVPALGISSAPVPVELEGRTYSHTQRSKLKNPVYCMLSAEAGYLFRYDDRNAVSLGLYGRYGLNKCKTDAADESLVMNNGQISVVQPSLSGIVDKMGYYEIGLRITYHYGLVKKK